MRNPTYQTFNEVEKKSLIYNKYHSEETKQKISEALKGRHFSEEHKRKMSEYMTGRTLSEETKRKISEYVTGRTHSEETNRKISETLKGHTVSEETKRKISRANKRRLPWHAGKTDVYSEETRNKMSKAKKGEVHPNYGKHHSEKTKRKISESHKGKNNPNWNNGSSFEPYDQEFNNLFKKQLREGYNYTCQICGKKGNSVHHIDYNKKNNDSSNLIILCNSCHGKTGTNRSQWIQYFYQQLIGEHQLPQFFREAFDARKKFI